MRNIKFESNKNKKPSDNEKLFYFVNAWALLELLLKVRPHFRPAGHSCVWWLNVLACTAAALQREAA
jgi:hypothetical protein